LAVAVAPDPAADSAAAAHVPAVDSAVVRVEAAVVAEAVAGSREVKKAKSPTYTSEDKA